MAELPISDEAMKAMLAPILREVVRPNPLTTWEDTAREAIQAFLAAEGFEIERGDVPDPELGWEAPISQHRLASPWRPE